MSSKYAFLINVNKFVLGCIPKFDKDVLKKSKK